MGEMPEVLSASELSNGGFVGTTTQVALVSDDLYGAIDNLVALGVGPWMIYDVGPDNSTDLHYRGEPEGFSMRLAFTSVGSMTWEVIEPVGGRSIYRDFLEEGHKGLHHIAISCDDAPYEESAAELRRRGYEELMGGRTFEGTVRMGYWHNGRDDCPWVEVFVLPPAFGPEPDEWYPAPPPG
jgi:Glyoxalase/Bleomycin resistance protein/Dioxygenase superfamily